MDERGDDSATTADAAPPDDDTASARPERALAAPHSRATTDAEWEVFVREAEPEPLRHVGSVTAPTAEAANEAASRLFDRFARDVWLCPADRVVRYSTDGLDQSTDAIDGATDTIDESTDAIDGATDTIDGATEADAANDQR